MVRMRNPSEADRLEAMLRELCRKHGFNLEIAGWARKTFDVFLVESRLGRRLHLARVESLAAANGEIRFFDDRATGFAEELGRQFEEAFGVSEAVLIRQRSPGGY